MKRTSKSNVASGLRPEHRATGPTLQSSLPASGASASSQESANGEGVCIPLLKSQPAATISSKTPGLAGAISSFSDRLNDDRRAVKAPRVTSFIDFLEQHARVPTSDLRRSGEFDAFTFAGREALREPCRVLDLILGSVASGLRPEDSATGRTLQDAPGPLKDSTLVLAGGAQFGKTILELMLASYVTSQRFLNVGIYLPDDGLADAIVDAKFRPIVLDNIPWFAEMTQIGKAVNKSGKSVNTKGAFLVTDGERKAIGLFRGLKKIPTSFSMDVVIRDEEDDIPRDKAKFLSGRMTASALRLQIIVGTQRVHGAGQNRQWEQSSQGVMLVGPDQTELQNEQNSKGSVNSVPPLWLCPEDHWPQICRLQLGSSPAATDPQLSWEGDFRRNGEMVGEYSPDATFYLAHPDTGEPLDRSRVLWFHRRPDRLKLRRFGFRIAQIGCAAIDLGQIVAHWTRAVGDSEEMVSFCCDRLARPKSAAQSLTPQILQRSRDIAPFDFSPAPNEAPRFAGLDTGDRCWFFLRERRSAAVKRCVRVDQIALGDVVNRVQTLCAIHGVSCIFIDERPAVNEARTLALALNGLAELERWPKVDWSNKETHVSLPGGLTWDGRNQRWLNLRCAVVRFTKQKLGAGIEQGAAEFDEGGQKRFVPMIECNRFESIDRAVHEFLTPAENVIEVVDVGGKRAVRTDPAMLLPRRTTGSPSILETLDAHLLTGSQRAKEEKTGELGDYVDGCDNHFLLADAYSALAETIGGNAKAGKFAYERLGQGKSVKRGRAMAV